MSYASRETMMKAARDKMMVIKLLVTFTTSSFPAAATPQDHNQALQRPP